MTWRIANYRVPIVKTWRLGSAADQAEFTRERAAALTADEGLRVLEELRRMRYDDPETPPRLERVFVLSSTAPRPLRRHRSPRTRDVEGERVGFLGLNEYVKTKLACGRPKDLLDIELLREIGKLDAVVRHRAKRPPAKTGKERAPAKAGKKAAPAQKAPVRRERHRMPADVKRALGSGKALAAYRARPPYQQNDYIGWITRAVRESTRAQRIAQMLSELAQGNVYMKMKWSGASAKRPAD